MKAKSMFPWSPVPLAAVALLLLAGWLSRTHAAFVFTVAEIGGSVVVNGSGTINTTELSPMHTVQTFATLDPSTASLMAGPETLLPMVIYSGEGLTGPTAIGGTPLSRYATSGTGSRAGISGSQSGVLLPQDYVSGTFITNSAIWESQTFASTGFTPGIYTWTWGSGPNADSLTIIGTIPEPTTGTLLGLGTLAAVGAMRRSRRWSVDSRTDGTRTS